MLEKDGKPQLEVTRTAAESPIERSDYVKEIIDVGPRNEHAKLEGLSRHSNNYARCNAGHGSKR